MPTLTIVRGAPGSGKSTLAKAVCEATGALHFEADQFWYTLGDIHEYAFDKSRLGEAHYWCLERVRKAVYAGADVVVSNTFTTQREIAPYILLARQYGYQLQEVICRGQFQNTHGVPQEVVDRKRRDIEL